MLFFISALETEAEQIKMADLYKQHLDRLMKVALSVTGNQAMAEDAVHNTFVAAIKHKEKLFSQDAMNFIKWSVIVVRGKSIDLLRREQRYADSSVDNMAEYLPSDAPAVEDQVIDKDIYERVIGHIAELDEISRLVVEMKYVLHMSYAEISDELMLTHSQINNRLMGAKAKIRKQMGSEVRGDGEK